MIFFLFLWLCGLICILCHFAHTLPIEVFISIKALRPRYYNRSKDWLPMNAMIDVEYAMKHYIVIKAKLFDLISYNNSILANIIGKANIYML